MKAIYFALVLMATSIALSAQNTTPPQLQKADSLYTAGNMEAAYKLYSSYLKDNQALPITYARMGFACYRIGQFDEAIQYLQQGLDKNPAATSLPTFQARMAMAYGSKKDNAKALEWLEKAQLSGYFNLFEMDNEPGFANIRDEPKFQEIYKAVTLNAYPCMSDSMARAFDFWIGDWEVYATGTSVRVGSNLIERFAGGCGILENWTPYNSPFSGKSINYYESTTGDWRQIWVGSGRTGATYYEKGKYYDGALRFTYKRTNPNGQEVTGNFIFYNLGPNRVRQYLEQSTDGGKTHTVVYDFTYLRKGSGEKPN
ncbi:MAG: tetratricopeptide repeat protein [Saprospiraceae bacterium]|nr:tetratricopeptide repeat protein [Saprospiraceae bacterium]